MRTLFLIPARAGSKGLPGKNTKLLNGKPLIVYSIEFARKIMGSGDLICVSSNDHDVINIARDLGLDVPFIRPEVLASDSAGSYEVIMHAIKFYEDLGCHFERVLLLQPTSPFREIQDFINLNAQFSDSCEMAVTVTISKHSPYFNLFEENDGFLEKSKPSSSVRRQDCPNVYAFNGSMYMISVKALKANHLRDFKKIVKSIMPENKSIDIDTMADWKLAEYYLSQHENENS